MSYKADPLIPQQAETVAEAVGRTSDPYTGGWTGREMVAGSDGIWHLMVTPNHRTALYPTRCGLWIEGREARTVLSGDPTCPRCSQPRRKVA